MKTRLIQQKACRRLFRGLGKNLPLAVAFSLAAQSTAKAASDLTNSLTGYTGTSEDGGGANQPPFLAGSGLDVTYVWPGGDGSWEKINFSSSGAKFGSYRGGWEGRNYLRTVDSLYAPASFTAYVTVNRASQQAVMFGMGTGNLGQYKAPDFNSGNASIFLELQDNAASATFFRISGTGAAPVNTQVATTPMTNGTGLMRLRMDYNSVFNTVVYSIDYGYAGGGFVADQTFSPVDVSSIASEWAAGEKSSIYFGGEDSMTFTDFQVSLITVTPGGLHHFVVTTAATSPQIAGDPFDVSITAQDVDNALVEDSTTTVTMSSPGGGLMEFDWDSNGVYGDNSGTLEGGVKTIKARNRKAETASISAVGGIGVTPTPPSVTAVPAEFAMLQILAPGETAAPGTDTGKTGTATAQTYYTPFNVTVNAVDSYWNLINTVTDSVGITSTDSVAVLPAAAPLVAGTGAFAVKLISVGSYTVTATAGSKTDTTPPLTVQQGSLVWQGGPANLWDTSAQNWNIAGTTLAYADGSIVLFNDTSTNRVVDIVGTLTPGSVTVNSTANYTLGSTSSGLIDGGTSLTKSGTGTLTLATENTYTGGTFVNGGTLSVSAIDDAGASALGNSGTLTLGGGKLSYTGSSAAITARAVSIPSNSTIELTNGSLTLNGAVSHTANSTLTKTGGGTLTLGGTVSNSYLLLNAMAGVVELGKNSSGTVNAVAGISGIANGATVILTGTGGDQIYDGIAPYGVNGLVAGGTLNLNGNSESIGVLNGTGGIVDGGSGTPTLTLGINNGSSTFGGVIQNSGGSTLSLVKIGTGSITLAGANTYSGPTTVNAGVLGLRKSSTSSITVAANAGLSLVVGGAGGYTVADVNALWTNSLSGATLNSTSLVGIDTSLGDVIYSSSPVTTNGFAKTGLNTLTLDGVNTGAFGGGTTVHAGVLSLANTAAKPLGTVTVNTGAGLALAVGASGAGFYTTADVDALWTTGMAGVTLNAASLVGIDTTQGDLTYTTPTTPNSRGFAKVGSNTLTLTGANGYTGGTLVGAGRLVLDNTITGGRNYTTNAELEIKLTSSNQTIHNGTFSGTGKLILSGDKTLTLGDWGGAQTIALKGADSVIDIQGGTLNMFYNFDGVPTASWSGNEAGLNVATGASLELKNANVVVDELNGFGTIKKTPWDLPITLTIGVKGGSGNFSGAITQYSGAGAVVSLVKQGTGTQTLSGVNTYTGGTTIAGGTLALGASDVLPGNISIGNARLNAATFTDTVGTLDVTAAATINLGSGGKLVFANSNGVDWTGGTLNITGSFVTGSSIKFATSGGLTATQLALITVNGKGAGTATLDSNGFLLMAISDPFAGWATGGQTFDGDANGDGVQDGLAWFLGAETPATNASDKLPKPAKDGAFLTLDFKRVNPYSPAKLFVEFGNDLSGWTVAEIPAAAGTIDLTGDDVVVEVTTGSPDSVKVKIPTSYQSASGALFARLRATNN